MLNSKISFSVHLLANVFYKKIMDQTGTVIPYGALFIYNNQPNMSHTCK